MCIGSNVTNDSRKLGYSQLVDNWGDIRGLQLSGIGSGSKSPSKNLMLRWSIIYMLYNGRCQTRFCHMLNLLEGRQKKKKTVLRPIPKAQRDTGFLAFRHSDMHLTHTHKHKGLAQGKQPQSGALGLELWFISIFCHLVTDLLSNSDLKSSNLHFCVNLAKTYLLF